MSATMIDDGGPHKHMQRGASARYFVARFVFLFVFGM